MRFFLYDTKTSRHANLIRNMLFAVVFAAPCLLPQHALASSHGEHGSEIITRGVVVREGDTLLSIARRELGKSGLASHLAEFNGLRASESLVVGDTIYIPLYAPPAEEFATVVFVKGEVLRDGKALQRDDKIYLADQISTGSNGFASIEFESGSAVNLQPDTSVRLERLNCLEISDLCVIQINATRGEVSSDVNRRDTQPVEYHIRTPYASAAVRGTYFEVKATGESVIMGVSEGEVVLSAQQVDVPVQEGFGSLAQKGKPPIEPVALLPAPVYRYIPARAATGDQVRWWGLSDVSSYAVDVTADEAGNQTITSITSDTDFVTIDNIDAGDYFMHVRGVDENGLKGYKTPTRLTVAALDPDTSPVDTRVTRQGSEFLVEVIEPPEDAPGFEIQISTNPQFDDPLAADISSQGAALFSVQGDKVYTRARVLLSPQLVSAFGGIAESQ